MHKDKILQKLIRLEKKRQQTFINLIASENYVSKSILETENSLLTNKYAEGYPNKRYYGGCMYIDKIETLAINRAKNLFNAHYVNVQPHSGTQANQAAYMSLCKPKDTILSMKLDHGGHLSHGHKKILSNQLYNFIHYKINTKTEYIDYNQIEYLTKKYKPKLIIAGTSAYSRIINWKTLKKIANKTQSFLLADISHVAGLIVSKLYPSPINIADITTLTTQKTLRGPRGGVIIAKKNPIIEKNINISIFPGLQGGPFMHTIAAKAICFKEATNIKFNYYQKQILKNTKNLMHNLKNENFNIISKGTDTHLFIINLKNKKLTGAKAEKKLESINIIVNKNTIPNDTSSHITNGIRIGTTAITTRGFKTQEINLLSKYIYDSLIKKKNIKTIKKNIIDLCKNYPL